MIYVIINIYKLYICRSDDIIWFQDRPSCGPQGSPANSKAPLFKRNVSRSAIAKPRLLKKSLSEPRPDCQSYHCLQAPQSNLSGLVMTIQHASKVAERWIQHKWLWDTDARAPFSPHQFWYELHNNVQSQNSVESQWILKDFSLRLWRYTLVSCEHPLKSSRSNKSLHHHSSCSTDYSNDESSEKTYRLRLAHARSEIHPGQNGRDLQLSIQEMTTVLHSQLHYPKPGLHEAHKFQPQNRKDESWSRACIRHNIHAPELVWIMHPKVTKVGRPIANKREASLALSRIPRRWPCCIAHSLLAGWTPTAVKSNQFSTKHVIARLIYAHGHIIMHACTSPWPTSFKFPFSPDPTPLLEIQHGDTPYPFWILWAMCPPRQFLGQKVTLRPATMALHTHRRPALGILLEQRFKLGSDAGAVDIDLVSMPPWQSNQINAQYWSQHTKTMRTQTCRYKYRTGSASSNQHHSVPGRWRTSARSWLPCLAPWCPLPSVQVPPRVHVKSNRRLWTPEKKKTYIGF